MVKTTKVFLFKEEISKNTNMSIQLLFFRNKQWGYSLLSMLKKYLHILEIIWFF